MQRIGNRGDFCTELMPDMFMYHPALGKNMRWCYQMQIGNHYRCKTFSKYFLTYLPSSEKFSSAISFKFNSSSVSTSYRGALFSNYCLSYLLAKNYSGGSRILLRG